MDWFLARQAGQGFLQIAVVCPLGDIEIVLHIATVTQKVNREARASKALCRAIGDEF